METRLRWAPQFGKVLIIAASWTLILVLIYIDRYLTTDDLIRIGQLSGGFPIWPDLIANALLGMISGLIGGLLLVFKVNGGYKHRTFISGIVKAVVLFVLLFVVGGLGVLFLMNVVIFAPQEGIRAGVVHAWHSVLFNLYTPSFVSSMFIWGGIVSATQFMLQVNDKFGPGVLWKLLRGKYYHPREEERIFMFLDLRSSTSIAEAVGHRRFFELLKELYEDITKPVIESRGEIYQYVGDEVVVTWPVERGLEDANCIGCFFRIEGVLGARTAHYLQRYGVAPRFKAGLHLGEATVGEIGVVKKDIVFSGDVLNTTSRIQEECNRHDVNLLVSSVLLQRVPMGASYESAPIGEIGLRGKAEAMELSTVRVH